MRAAHRQAAPPTLSGDLFGASFVHELHKCPRRHGPRSADGLPVAGELAQKPPTERRLPGALDAMANCIVAGSQRLLFTVTPTFSAGRAQVVVTNPAGAVLGTFDIRQMSGGGTEVSYRSIYGGPAWAPAAMPATSPIAAHDPRRQPGVGVARRRRRRLTRVPLPR